MEPTQLLEAEEVASDTPLFELEPLPPGKKLGLAKETLLGLAVLFLAAGIAGVFGGEPGQLVFDTCAKAIPPIATLILGYYFAVGK